MPMTGFVPDGGANCACASVPSRPTSEPAKSDVLKVRRSIECSLVRADALHLHAGMIVLHAAAPAARSLGSDRLDLERHGDLTGLLEFQRDWQLVALLQRALQLHHHQMIAARRQR